MQCNKESNNDMHYIWLANCICWGCSKHLRRALSSNDC